MSETINGTIEAVKKDNKAVKVGDDWYSVRNASALAGAKKGDAIVAQFERNGRWNNLDEGSVSVTPGTGGSSGGSSSGGGGKASGGNDQFRSRIEIIRTTALESAIAFHQNTDEESDYIGSVEKVLKSAALFVAFVEGKVQADATTDPAAEAANEELKQQAADAEAARLVQQAEIEAAAKAQAEAQTAAAPSALSSFLGT